MSILFAVVTIVGVCVFLYKELRNYSLYKGIMYSNRCTIQIFLSHEYYYVPIKILQTMGVPTEFTAGYPLFPRKLILHKNWIWDTLEIDWSCCTIQYENRRLATPNRVVISIWQKWMVRNILKENYNITLMLKEHRNWHKIRITGQMNSFMREHQYDEDPPFLPPASTTGIFEPIPPIVPATARAFTTPRVKLPQATVSFDLTSEIKGTETPVPEKSVRSSVRRKLQYREDERNEANIL